MVAFSGVFGSREIEKTGVGMGMVLIWKMRFLVGERKSYKLDLDKFYVSPQKLNYSRGLAL